MAVPWLLPVLRPKFFLCVFLCMGAPEGSTSSGSGFIVSQKTWPWLKVSSDRLGELGIKLRTLGYKASDLSTTPRQLFLSENTLTISRSI